MTFLKRRTTRLVAVAITAIFAATFAAPAVQAATADTITVLTDNETDKPIIDGIAAAFMKANPDITVNVEYRPGGTDGDNIIKTRLATGTMDDVFLYNSGSLFQAMNPTKNLVDLTNEPWQSTVLSSFKQSVSVGKKVYGAPIGTAMGGGILYNKAIYAKLGLKVPLTWSQFMSNNQKIKKAGLIPVIQSYKDTWTSQLFVLSDEFNVQAAVKNFPALYTANKAKIAKTPAAMAGFNHLQDVKKAGFLNKDYASATFDKALNYLATGKGAHYPMLTFAAGNIVANYPELANNIGFFAQPGNNAKSNGLTVWMPAGLYIPNTTTHLASAKAFVAFSVSPAGIAAMNAAASPSGPYLIKGAKLTGQLSVIATDMLSYFKTDATSAPALEFLSPIKGPNLEKFCVEVGSGIKTAKQGAAAYDLDVQKQAQQLGLKGW